MDERRAYLKQLAARSARRWSSTPLPGCFAGEVDIETRNTCYRLRDGICFDVSRHEGAGLGSSHPSEFVGMQVVGWLLRDAPTDGLTHAWQPGAYAVLWRPRQAHEAHSAVALTSATQAFRPGARASVPPPLPRPSAPPRLSPPPATASRTGRVSTRPPLPLAIPRAALLPQPVTPPSWIPPPPLSTTRLHMSELLRTAPPAPETPTPVRRSSVPPPLPPAARAARPLPPRLPAHG